MKKVVLLLAASFAVMLALALTAGAAPAPKATGSFGFDRYGTSGAYGYAAFDAQGTTLDAKGNIWVVIYNEDGSFNQFWYGHVTCYYQDNDTYTAHFSGVVDWIAPGSGGPSNNLFKATVVDNGEGTNSTAADQFEFERQSTLTGNPALCYNKGPLGDLTSGNLQVHVS